MRLFEKYNVRKYESQLPCYKGLFISLPKLQLSSRIRQTI